MANPITPERRKQLAEKHGINEQYLYQCLTGRRDMGPAEAMRIETETGKELTRQMLCQKTHVSIWPDLLEPDTVEATELQVPAIVTTDPVLAADFVKAEQAGYVKLPKAEKVGPRPPGTWDGITEDRVALDQRRAVDRARDAKLAAYEAKEAGQGA